eukprot:SAG22_NODE_13065_length_420_cov_0.909657_1_plen_70_part_10
MGVSQSHTDKKPRQTAIGRQPAGAMARPAALPLLAAATLAAVPAASAQSCGSFAEFSLLLGPMNEACCVG